MNTENFRKYAHELVEWMADYLENVEKLPVKPNINPGEIKDKLPSQPPEKPENFSDIFYDFRELILPGITHWQSPNFFGYFPANNSKPSILAEMLTATMGAQCMSWLTSPAATELEEQLMEWLRQMIHLPETFTGVIQDTASTSTLCALLTAREKKSGYMVNQRGFTGEDKFTVYCSTHAHSSIDKDVKIAGLGIENLVKIPVDENYALIPNLLEEQIKSDIEEGKTPLAVISALGTTSSTAIDPIRSIGEICQKYAIWHHVDAAYAGTALILPEKRWMADGVEMADSFVFNPHKWMFTNFDCSAYFVKDPDALIKTFSITPEYLKTFADEKAQNYRDWGIQLGRRFRALKIWFVIRNLGIKGLQDKLNHHLNLTNWLVSKMENHPDFELLAPVPLNTICFRFHPSSIKDEDKLNKINEDLINHLNNSGQLFLTHTKLDGKFTIRLVIGQTEVREKHVDNAWEMIKDFANKLINV